MNRTIYFAGAVLCVLALPMPLAGQNQLIQSFGGTEDEAAYGLARTADNGYLLGGFTTGFGTMASAVMLARFDAVGDNSWTVMWSGDDDDAAYSLLVRPDDGSVLAGYTTSFGFGGPDALIVAFDAAGQQDWAHVLGGDSSDFYTDVALCACGGFIAVGYSSSFTAGTDAMISQYSETGVLIETILLAGDGFDKAAAVVPGAGVTQAIAGFTNSAGAGEGDILVGCIDDSGALLWAATVGSEARDDAADIARCAGGYLVAGYTAGFGAGSYDAMLTKVDDLGHHIWTRTIGSSGIDYALSVCTAADGGCYLCGASEAFGGNYRQFLAKFSASGAHLWTRGIGELATGEAWVVQPGTGGGCVLAGTITSHGSGGLDMLLAKFSEDGYSCLTDTLDLEVQSVEPLLEYVSLAVEQIMPMVTTPEPVVTNPQPILTRICRLVCGDADSNGIVNVSDAVYLIAYIFGGGPAPNPLLVGDADCNGIINVSDAVYLIGFIFGGGPEPCAECP